MIQLYNNDAHVTGLMGTQQGIFIGFSTLQTDYCATL